MAFPNIDQYRFLIENVKDGDNRASALENIKSFLDLKSSTEAAPMIRQLGISKIVQCFNSSDKHQIELTCDVIEIIFSKFEPGETIKCYTSIFMYMLRHEEICVQELALLEVYKVVTTNLDELPVPQYIDLFVAIAQLVFKGEVRLANKAILIISKLPPEAYPKILEEMKIGLEYNSSVKCYTLEIIINISSKSPDLFKLCTEQEYITFMIAELQSEDFLYQINILELLSKFALQPHGIKYLVECGGLDKIVDMLIDLDNNPLRHLLLPGYMRFFGCVAFHYPKEVLKKYPVLVDSLFTSLESDEQVILLIALDTLAIIGQTCEGKMCLAALGGKYIIAIDRVCQLIKNSPSLIKVRAIHCLANLITVQDDDKSQHYFQRVTLMTREWFRALSKQPESTLILFDICKNPFPDIKLAGFTLLHSICQHKWGEEMVAGVAGFIEYLLDRPTYFNREEKEAKYKVIESLSKNATVFDENIVSRLQTYVEQGPLYNETVLQIALEEGD